MQPISLALFWHQHQPYYPDDVSGETLMPWVRLHGTKDYYGMALHLKEVPKFRCTINLVPSLLVQIQRYTDRKGSDRHLDVSRIPAADIPEVDALYMLDQFFMASVDNVEDNTKFAKATSVTLQGRGGGPSTVVEKKEADFPLLADPTKEVATKYGVLMAGPGLANRWTFYIDKEGKIAYIEKKVNPATSAEDMIAKLAEMKVPMHH